MGLIIFFTLCLIDIILLSAHWYIPFFLLSLYLFWTACVGIYYFTRPTKQDKIKAMKELLEYYIEQDKANEAEKQKA